MEHHPLLKTTRPPLKYLFSNKFQLTVYTIITTMTTTALSVLSLCLGVEGRYKNTQVRQDVHIFSRNFHQLTSSRDLTFSSNDELIAEIRDWEVMTADITGLNREELKEIRTKGQIINFQSLMAVVL